MLIRVNTSKEDSDIAYFYDLILLGELITKTVTSFMVANICDDVDRNRYRYEYTLVHADGIGDYAVVLNDLITSNSANSLTQSVFETELMELRNKAIEGSWQREALIRMSTCLKLLKIDSNDLTLKSSLCLWFTMFTN